MCEAIVAQLTHRLRRALPLRELGFHALEYTTDSFSLSAFASAGLALPPSIVRSVEKRQAEFYFGRFCAREALRQLGTVGTDVLIGAGRAPGWPAGLVGSITHTGKMAAAIVGHRRQCAGIGIDIELPIAPDLVDGIALSVARDGELSAVASAGAFDVAQALTLIFSAKEAFFKASYAAVNDYFDFSVASLVDLDTQEKIARLRLHNTLGPGFPAGAIFDIHYEVLSDGSVFTMCVHCVIVH